MNVEETKKIIDILLLNYPDNFKGASNERLIGTIKLWHTILADDSYRDVQAAVLAFIASDTGRFFPPVGAIKQKLNELRNADGMTEMEAWNCVMTAIRNSSYNSEEEFSKMPAICQKIVGSPNQLKEWAMTEDLNDSVISSNFFRSYRVMDKQRKDMETVPESVKRLLNMTASKIGITER